MAYEYQGIPPKIEEDIENHIVRIERLARAKGPAVLGRGGSVYGEVSGLVDEFNLKYGSQATHTLIYQAREHLKLFNSTPVRQEAIAALDEFTVS